jgi:hypothetical protein
MAKKKTSVIAAAPPPPPRTIDRFLWDAGTLVRTEVALSTAPDDLRRTLEGTGITLDHSQWNAWTRALTHRLTLIWGPPGTGKTRTLVAVLAGACAEALRTGRPIRILVSAFTYKAIDNVLEKLSGWAGMHATSVRVFRLRSGSKEGNPALPAGSDVVTDTRRQEYRDLKNLLLNPEGVAIVGATPQQIYNFVTDKNQTNSPIAELFDFIALDEGSQLDVGSSIPPVCAAAAGAQIVVAGDPMQLAPISSAVMPAGAEAMLGSIYVYLKERFDLDTLQQVLEINYRSNETIVAFGRMLGYPRQFRPNSHDLRIGLTSALHAGPDPPPGWPADLVWTPEWARILDPAVTAVCFHYDEGKSGQSNPFEAQAVASLVWLLRRHLALSLLNEVGSAVIPPALHPPESFWEKGVGIVTPHVAQRGLITTALQKAFRGTGEDRMIREAIDTVEKYQGGERQVMIASFSVGDPDVVAQEEEFLLGLNRFNVMASRARAKLVVFVSDQLLDHLANDRDVLEESRAIKTFAHGFCNTPVPLNLPWRDATGSAVREASGIITVRS